MSEERNELTPEEKEAEEAFFNLPNLGEELDDRPQEQITAPEMIDASNLSDKVKEAMTQGVKEAMATGAKEADEQAGQESQDQNKDDGKDDAAGEKKDDAGETDQPTDEDKEGISDLDPDREFKIKERIRNRKAREAMAKQAQPAPAPEPQPQAPPPAPEPQGLTDTQVARTIRAKYDAQQVIDGFSTQYSDEQAKDMLAKANILLSRLDDGDQVLRVHDAAARGEFGDVSIHIQQSAREMQPLVDRRHQIRVQEDRGRQEAFNTQLNTVYSKYPDLNPFTEDGKQKTQEQKHPSQVKAEEWFNRNVGTPERPGPYLALAQSPNGLVLVSDIIMNEIKSSSIADKEAENRSLQAKVEAMTAPGSSRGAVLTNGDKPSGKSAEQQELDTMFDTILTMAPMPADKYHR